MNSKESGTALASGKDKVYEGTWTIKRGFLIVSYGVFEHKQQLDGNSLRPSTLAEKLLKELIDKYVEPTVEVKNTRSLK